MNSTLEQRLHSDLHEIASTIDTTPRPLPALARRSRRAPIFVAGLLATGVVAGGVAVAANLIPDDVADVATQMSDNEFCGQALLDQARIVASAQRADGRRLELWATPTSTDNIATSLRMVNADGTFEASGSGCGYDTPNDWAGGGYEIPGEYLTNNDESVSFEGIIDVSGRTSLDTDTVRVTFPPGGTVTAEVQDDGYFVTSVTGNVSLYNGTPTVEAAG